MAMRQRSDIVVVIDRSRDALRSGDLVRLHEDECFRVTENERRLTSRTLDRCDVLVIQTCGPAGYTAAEVSAIRQFVRTGGGLLLTTSAAIFEVGAGRPVAESAAQQMADLFKVRFLSPTEAKGRTHYDERLNCGFRRRDLTMSAVGPLAGLRLDDLVVRRSAPLEVPRGARVMLHHRRTGEPVAATLRVGRGRVLVAGAVEFGQRWETVGRPVVRWLAGARRRRAAAKPLPDVLSPTWHNLRRGPFRVRFRGASRARVEAILRVVRDLDDRFRRLFGRRKPMTWRVEIVPGVGARLDWNWRTHRHALRIGTGTCEHSLVYDLAFAMVMRRLRFGDGYGGLLYRSLGAENFFTHLALRAMEWCGFEREAAERRAILESWPDDARDPRSIDLGRWYSETGPSPALWLWRALEDDFGPKIIDRFLTIQPKTFPWKSFPHGDVVTHFDILIYYLSLAAKRDLFGWFAEHGMTVHPIPLVPVKDTSFKRRVLAPFRRQVRDTDAPVSERYDAARAIQSQRRRDTTSLTREAQALRSGDEADRLIAAARLARARDPRGTKALHRLVQHAADPAYAAIAACALVEMGDETAADRLIELARQADARFQLDAHAALARVGRQSPAPFRISARRDGELLLVAEVEGYGAANVFSRLTLGRWPQGVAIPHLYIDWVHTAPKWRRKGLSRALFGRTDADRWARAAATGGLETGTTNTAHSLYRSVGFIDLCEGEERSRPLANPPRPPHVKGVRLRRATDRDVQGLTDLFNEVYRDYLGVRRRRAAPLQENAIAVLAEKDRKPVGYLIGALGEPDEKGRVTARISQVCVKDGKACQQVTHALVARWCALVAGRGATRARVWRLPEADPVLQGFQAAGFTSRKTGDVEMWRLHNLPLLLQHIRPLLEHRLKEKKRGDWRGTIALLGRKHRAALAIDRGKVTVLKSIPKSPSIALEGDDDAISRLIAGRRTAFQAFLQLELRITPKPNRDVTTLLDGLFPRMPVYLA